MKKRMLSLLCVLALCLGLLPVTALAAAEGAPNSLYVGNQQVISSSDITYWTTDESTGGLTKYEGNNDNWNVKYDPSTATLTLSGATIKGGSDVVSIPYGSGIYAQGSSNQPVTLTIELIGENTITGTFGIYVNATPPTTPGTDASLVIKKSGDNGDNGSLTVTGTGNSGLHIISGTGDASLTIKNASVDAKTTQTYSSYAGVCVQSGASATDSPQLSLAVNGGSLTVSGSTSGDGIQFYVGSSQATGATTSLTVSENAIVDARNGGISALKISETLPTPTPTGDNRSGIVFDGSTGTVYGTVALQNELTIGEGESLTVPEGSSLNCNRKLTNNGTILASGGTVTGSLSGGSEVTTPSISAQPTGQTVTEGSAAEFSITASDEQTYQWQQSTDSGSNWTNIESATSAKYTTEATTTSMSGYQYRCVVKSASGVSVISNAATLTVQAKPAPVSVTGVSLDKATLELYTGDSATLTATVEPSDAANQNVTWQSDNANVATVEGGTVTAVGVGETTIRVTTEEGNYTATCKVTVTQSTYSISADTTALNFGSVYTGYAQPAARTVTITNTGNQTQPLTLTASTGSFEVGTLTKTQLAAGEKATFTVQPKAGLAVGTYSENITVSGTGGATVTITANFTVKQYSSGGGTPTKTPSQQAVDKIESAKDGSTVEITLRPGRTTLEREVFEELAGQDITLEIDAGDGVLWTVNGLDIPEDTRLHDLDLDVDLGDSDIPATVLNAVTGEIGTVQLSLAHDGQFGFTMTLSAPLGRDNTDYWANLYWYNERTEELEFQQADRIARDGTAEFALDHASDYAIVIDDRSHEPVDLPFADVPESYWAYDAIQYVYGEGLMAGTSGSTFSPEGTTTRGQIVTILWRLSGSPVVNYLMDFDDVDPAAYYGEAIRWAASEGIAGGYGNGSFGPDDPITREQLAVMLHRYAQHQGYDVSIGEDTNILSYADAFDVSEYAVSALQWACGAGIISGTGDGSTLTPQGEATRAQAATVLMRFCEEYVTM